MKKIIVMLATVLLSLPAAFGQVDKMKDILDDEMDTENYTLRFFDALTGNPIKGAVVEIDETGVYETDHEGKVKFPRIIEDGGLTVRFQAEGYIPTDLTVEVIAATIFNNRISISPQMAMEYFRVILDWGRNPDDLDAHFMKEDDYHISYRNMKTAKDGVATLDRDDTDKFGPETITVREIESDAGYAFWVQDFSNRNDDNSRRLSRSGAAVKVYGNGKLLEYVTVPEGQRGNKWNVFIIRNGKIELTNYVSSMK
ncbi:MAG: YfaP family protein [Bacteroidales bacterium]